MFLVYTLIPCVLMLENDVDQRFYDSKFMSAILLKGQSLNIGFLTGLPIDKQMVINISLK